MDGRWFVIAGIGLMFGAGLLIALLKEVWDVLGWVHWVILPFMAITIAAMWVGGAILFIGGMFDT